MRWDEGDDETKTKIKQNNKNSYLLHLCVCACIHTHKLLKWDFHHILDAHDTGIIEVNYATQTRMI